MSKEKKPGRNKIISRLTVQDRSGNGKAKEFFFPGPSRHKDRPNAVVALLLWDQGHGDLNKLWPPRPITQCSCRETHIALLDSSYREQEQRPPFPPHRSGTMKCQCLQVCTLSAEAGTILPIHPPPKPQSFTPRTFVREDSVSLFTTFSTLKLRIGRVAEVLP